LEGWIKLADRTTLQCDSPTAGLITDDDDRVNNNNNNNDDDDDNNVSCSELWVLL
jgi:hypothetical protein